MHELFISYCRHDLGAANALADTFSKAGLSVWMDRKGVQEGAAFDTQIEEAIAARLSLRPMPSLSCKQVFHCRAVGCFIFMSARCSWSHAAVRTGARAFTERHSRQSSAMILHSLEPSAMADLNRRLKVATPR